jgi:hypothetical protein
VKGVRIEGGQAHLPDHELNELSAEYWLKDFQWVFNENSKSLSGQEGGLAPLLVITK